jgi:hypothetical protein
MLNFVEGCGKIGLQKKIQNPLINFLNRESGLYLRVIFKLVQSFVFWKTDNALPQDCAVLTCVSKAIEQHST